MVCSPALYWGWSLRPWQPPAGQSKRWSVACFDWQSQWKSLLSRFIFDGQSWFLDARLQVRCGAVKIALQAQEKAINEPLEVEIVRYSFEVDAKYTVRRTWTPFIPTIYHVCCPSGPFVSFKRVTFLQTSCKFSHSRHVFHLWRSASCYGNPCHVVGWCGLHGSVVRLQVCQS